MLKRILTLLGFVIVILLIDWEWVANLRKEDADYFIAALQDEVSYDLLFVTLPLMILQGVVTLFPVLLLIIVHFIAFGIVEGFLYSFIGTCFGSLLCFWLAKSLGGEYVNKFWKKREKTLKFLLKWITHYGVLFLVILRSIPVLPSNIISISAAISPIRLSQYVWSTILGNISMIWLLSLLSAPLLISEVYFMPYIITYSIYVLLLFSYYGYRFFKGKHRVSEGHL